MSNVLNTRLPSMRVSDLVMTEAGEDTLVYDSLSHGLHTLNAVTTGVWRACDGQQTLGSLMIATGHDEATVRHALTLLADANLLEGELPADVRTTQSRRAFMKKAAIAGGVAIPAIVSISAPAAAQNMSPFCGMPCTVLAFQCLDAADNCVVCIPASIWTPFQGTCQPLFGVASGMSSRSSDSRGQAMLAEQQAYDAAIAEQAKAEQEPEEEVPAGSFGTQSFDEGTGDEWVETDTSTDGDTSSDDGTSSEGDDSIVDSTEGDTSTDTTEGGEEDIPVDEPTEDEAVG